jgi:hypothetical protein
MTGMLEVPGADSDRELAIPGPSALLVEDRG